MPEAFVMPEGAAGWILRRLAGSFVESGSDSVNRCSASRQSDAIQLSQAHLVSVAIADLRVNCFQC